MAGTGFFFDEACFWHTTGEHALMLPVGGWVQPGDGAGHAEAASTKRRLKALIDVSGLAARLAVASAPPATEEDARRVHTADYLARFRAASERGHGSLGLDAPCGPGTYAIALRSAGLGIGAVGAVLAGRLANAYALTRPPGHHCLPDAGMGFCFLANIAIAIEWAQVTQGVGRVAVVDWDVHHGNGTQAIFWERPDVLTVSLHQERCFPTDQGHATERGGGRGAGTNLNIPLLPGSGHAAYLAAFDRLVRPALERFRPELLVVACGLDANAFDPLGRMMLHSGSFRALTARVAAAAADLCGGRLVMLHEGGYSDAYVPFCGLAVIEELAGHRTAVRDPLEAVIAAQQPGPAHEAVQGQILEAMAVAAGL